MQEKLISNTAIFIFVYFLTATLTNELENKAQVFKQRWYFKILDTLDNS